MSTSTNSAISENAPARKFMFERTFVDGESLAKKERDRPKPTFTEEQLDAARKESYDSGYAAGHKTKSDDQQQQLNALMAQVEKKLDKLKTTGEEYWHNQLDHMQQVALVIARKILPTYIEKYGLEEIQTIISKIITEMAREPRLVVRVCDTQFDAVNAKITEIAERRAYAGKVVVLSEEGLDVSDCKVEWADGGVERDLRTVWQDIDKIMGRTESSEIKIETETQPPQQQDNAGEQS